MAKCPTVDPGLPAFQAFVRRIQQKLSAKGKQNHAKSWSVSVRIIADAEYGTLGFDWAEDKEYRTCLASIIGAARDSVGPETADNWLRRAIFRALDLRGESDERDFEKRLKRVVAELRTLLTSPPTRWLTGFRVRGLSVDSVPLQIGKVRFVAPGDEGVSALIDGVVQLLASGHPRPRQETLDTSRDQLQTTWAGEIVALVDVTAVQPEGAKLTALEELRLTLDVINFYADLVEPRGLHLQVYLPGDVETVNETIPVLSDLQCSIRAERWGPMREFVLAGERLSRAEALGLLRLREMLAKERRTEVEKRMVAAVRWAGRATVRPRREESFLLYAIALESLLLERSSGTDLTYKLATRAAHLLGRNPDERRGVLKEITQLYATRSGIVHRGETEVADEQVSLIRYYTKLALVKVLRNDKVFAMERDEQFTGWLTDQVMGYSSDEPLV